MAKDRYHVVPNKEGGWNVKQEGVNAPLITTQTKEQAVDLGRGQAQNSQGQLIIHDREGKIQEERTYRKDPFPPEG